MRSESSIQTRVDLSWPSRTLHPNARPHWAKKAKAVKAARGGAYLAARAAKLVLPEADAYRVVLTFSPPSNHARDDDGLLASMKSALDGLADYLKVDDSVWRFETRRGENRKGGNVNVRFEKVIHSPTLPVNCGYGQQISPLNAAHPLDSCLSRQESK